MRHVYFAFHYKKDIFRANQVRNSGLLFGAESVGLRDVTTAGDHATWSVAILQPVKVTLKCSVEVAGDTMSGSASAGFFGKFALSGGRVTA